MKFIQELEEICRNVVNELQGRWDFYRHRMYLKKMGWTEEAYIKQTDPLVNKCADRLSYFYYGYKHTHVFTSAREKPFTDYETWMDAYVEANLWCEVNCRGRWREDIHRVIKQTGLDSNGKEFPEYFINEVGGGDALVYAFEDSRDYTMFILRWT